MKGRGTMKKTAKETRFQPIVFACGIHWIFFNRREEWSVTHAYTLEPVLASLPNVGSAIEWAENPKPGALEKSLREDYKLWGLQEVLEPIADVVERSRRWESVHDLAALLGVVSFSWIVMACASPIAAKISWSVMMWLDTLW